MAQSSSLAREPSMEEILASIRRIIEESDTGKPDDLPPVAVNSDAPRFARADDLERGEEPEAEQELPPREGIALSRPFTQPAEPAAEAILTDAVLKPAIDDEAVEADELPSAPAHSAPAPVAPAPVAKAPEVKAPEVKAPEAKAPEDEMPELAEDEAPTAHPVSEAVQPPAEKDEQPSQPEAVSKPPVPEATQQPAPGRPEIEDELNHAVSSNLGQALEPILSAAAERQVSAAFDDLSFAVRSEPRRSFDEIAQDIMRPLLQEWLDDNLPTLVERLVREEIERVVRGGVKR
ncbi:DUF2497 domain-containing protein [Phyllobacterium sp. 21LDTY02-6]|nr:DUF2497 domain-containing protein [Phyllobacterium sp. 21LDTY02-6]MCO4316381.1 DUF2497 domain-containing protein [Phyllobacterium sp. 21LDTY02-6]